MSGLPGSPVTAADGFYSASVDAGWSGEARPSRGGFKFDPAFRTYGNVASDQFDQNYTGREEEESFAFPNPFNPELEPVQIRFVLSNPANAIVRILDARGDIVREIVSGGAGLGNGEHLVSWDGRNARGHFVGNGIYFYAVITGANQRITGKIAVVR